MNRVISELPGTAALLILGLILGWLLKGSYVTWYIVAGLAFLAAITRIVQVARAGKQKAPVAP